VCRPDFWTFTACLDFRASSLSPYIAPHAPARKTISGSQLPYNPIYFAKWVSTSDNKIRGLSLVGFSPNAWARNIVSLVVLSYCTTLDTFNIHNGHGSGDYSATHIYLTAFRPSFRTLKTLIVAAKNPPTSGNVSHVAIHPFPGFRQKGSPGTSSHRYGRPHRDDH
jgi:hypothetical protein